MNARELPEFFAFFGDDDEPTDKLTRPETTADLFNEWHRSRYPEAWPTCMAAPTMMGAGR